ncbi:hypothetical protein TNCV_1401311 [Trichonephila clavipes]|nr:hypothetical protein TNCV_1401311 [Trichonephila clavipes]
MADDVMSCEGCQSLKILLNKKDEEIKRLNLEIQNLTISLQQFQNQTECDSNCCSSYDTSDADACTEKSKVDTNNSTDIGSDTSKEWHFQKNEDSQIINEEKEDNFSPCKKADIETNDLFVLTRGMPNSPSQMIPDMLDWRQIWRLGRPRKDSKCGDSLITPLLCDAKHCLVEKWLMRAVA